MCIISTILVSISSFNCTCIQDDVLKHVFISSISFYLPGEPLGVQERLPPAGCEEPTGAVAQRARGPLEELAQGVGAPKGSSLNFLLGIQGFQQIIV